MEVVNRITSSRPGTAALALLAALAAVVAVLLYVNHYRTAVDKGGTPATVLVAKKPIPKGMSVAAALSGGYVETQQLRTDELAAGAVTDPSAVRDRVATHDVLPGEQLTAGALGASASGLSTQLTGAERAVAVAVDSSHGIADQVQQGDHVDVLASFGDVQGGLTSSQPVVKTLLQDVPVLETSSGSSASGSQDTTVVLEVTTPQAGEVAYAAENGKIWLVLRPRAGAPTVASSSATLQTLLGSR